MRTKSQRFHLRIRSIHLVVFILMMSQTLYSQSALSGLGIEIGGGYNQLLWQSPSSLFPGSNETRFDRTHFALTPEVRLNYNILLADKFTCIPFVGYNRFGGQGEDSPVLQNGIKLVKSTVWFDALEVGFFTTYIVSDFSFGIGYKANRQFKVTDIVDIPNVLMPNTDVTDSFPTWSHDIGLRMSYRLSHYSISAESWFGISDLGGNGGFSQMNIRQNHFRLLFGYTI